MVRSLPRPHLYLVLFAIFIGLTVSLEMVFSQAPPTVSHPLSQIAKANADRTAVDSTGSSGPGLGSPNDIIDDAEDADLADTASSAPCSGVTGTTAGTPCATGFAARTRAAALIGQDNTDACITDCEDVIDSCYSNCRGPDPTACELRCDDNYEACSNDCNAGGDNTYNACTIECTTNSEICTVAWQTYSTHLKVVSCGATDFARDCRCLKRQ